MVWHTPGLAKNGQPFVMLHKCAQGAFFVIPHAADFLISNQTVSVWVENDLALIPYFLGRVLGLWLETQKMPVLHGACLKVSDHAIGLLGQSGMGKSTMAAAMLNQSSQLLSDDLIPLVNDDGDLTVFPGIPQMRVWPDTGCLFFENFAELPRVHPAYEKRKAQPEDVAKLRLATQAAKMRVFVVLVRKNHMDGSGFELKRLLGAQAMLQLIANSYNVEALEALGLQAARLKILAKIAAEIPVWELTYKSDYQSLPHIAQTLEKQLP